MRLFSGMRVACIMYLCKLSSAITLALQGSIQYEDYLSLERLPYTIGDLCMRGPISHTASYEDLVMLGGPMSVQSSFIFTLKLAVRSFMIGWQVKTSVCAN
jgi:hypothetical protein